LAALSIGKEQLPGKKQIGKKQGKKQERNKSEKRGIFEVIKM